MRSALAALAVLLLLHAVASATVVLRTDVEDLTDLCHRAVLARVESQAVETEADSGRIWTTWRVRVEESWLGGLDGGGAADRIVVSVPGGAAGGVTQDYEGGARLDVGGRSVLFLWKRPDGRYLVVGEAQGAFRVRRDDAAGIDVCENDIEGLALVDRAGKTAEATPLKLSLADLRTRVAAARERRAARDREARAAYERRMAERRARAERSAALSRGKPGGAPAE